MVITTAQLHSTKPELRFCAGSNPVCGVLEIRHGGDLWQWSQLETRLNAFHQPTIPQKQFIIIIIIIIIIFEKDGVFSKFMISFCLKSMPYVDIFYKWPMKTVMVNKWQGDSNPGNSACYFFDITGNFISSTLPVLFFFWNNPLSATQLGNTDKFCNFLNSNWETIALTNCQTVREICKSGNVTYFSKFFKLGKNLLLNLENAS